MVGRLGKLGLVIVGAAVAFSGMGTAALGAAGDWPLFKYAATQNAYNSAEKTIGVSNVGSLGTAWTRSFATAKFVGVPVVSGGHLYSLISGGVISMKAKTGKTRWRVRLAGVNSGRIGVQDDVVYVSTGNGLYALDAATGAQLWTFSGHFDGGGVVIAGGTVFVGGVVVYAINAATGQEEWQHDALWGNWWPIVANGVVYMRNTDQLLALDADTGAVLWTASDRIPLFLYRSNLFAYYSGLHALDPATGATKWTQEKICCAMVAANGRVYSNTPDGWSALNAGTGNILWSRSPSHQVYDAVIANGVVYVDEDAVAGEGTLRALDAATGASLATLPGHVGPVISHGVVYTVDNHFNDNGVPTLYALKP
jgi:outer membrane protein assembly factor BamB